jgi:hypothetical protein
VFGGSFRVIASDRSGSFVGGRVLLVDAEGTDRTPGFLPENSPEETPSSSVFSRFDKLTSTNFDLDRGVPDEPPGLT